MSVSLESRPRVVSAQAAGGEVALRPYPYPYRAALTICSDIDRTRTLERFLTIQEFLNTERETAEGPGVGLEVGNTFFPYAPDGSIAYLSSGAAERDAIRTLIHAGYVDCVHSFGDGVDRRDLALRALDMLERDACRLTVWVDHAKAPTNFGKDVTFGSGDVPTSPAYHADATLAYGVRFVWKGRASSITGQDTPLNPGCFASMVDAEHRVSTVTNAAKDAAKVALARLGNRRFAMHRDNRLVAVSQLADGQKVLEFKRCNSHWLGLSYGHCASGLAYVLRPAALDYLTRVGGATIVYTHLGTGPYRHPYIPPSTQQALRDLAERQRRGDVYVTTTARLLAYHTNRAHLRWSAETDADGRTVLRIAGVDDPIAGLRRPDLAELQGITFYVPDADRALVYYEEEEVARIERHPADHTGRPSVGIPRTRLSYPLPPWHGH